jgi:hypothetical protein
MRCFERERRSSAAEVDELLLSRGNPSPALDDDRIMMIGGSC